LSTRYVRLTDSKRLSSEDRITDSTDYATGDVDGT